MQIMVAIKQIIKINGKIDADNGKSEGNVSWKI